MMTIGDDDDDENCLYLFVAYFCVSNIGSSFLPENFSCLNITPHTVV